MTNVTHRSALAVLVALSMAAAAHAAPPPANDALKNAPAGGSYPADIRALVAEKAAAAARPASTARPTRKPESVKAASSLPTLAEIMARSRSTTAAGPDSFLLRSSSFDVLGGGCDPRGWTAEDRANRVFAHVSDRYTVNRDLFGWTPATSPPTLPAEIEGTPITMPQNLAANDSGIVFYVEHRNDGARIVALYPGQNVMRAYANLPGGPDRGFDIAYSKATGGLIVGATHANGTGLLYHVPAGGGTPVEIAGGGFTLLDAPVHDAAIVVPEEMVTDAAGNIYFCELGQPPNAWPRVRMMRAADSTIVTLAGRLFWFGDDGDGGPGVNSTLMYPRGLALNATEDTLYILEGLANRVRSLSLTTGTIDALPGAQSDDFLPNNGLRVSPFTLTYGDGRLYVGCYDGATVAWQGGELTLVSGKGSSLVFPEESSLATAHDFGGTIHDLCPAPGGGFVFIDSDRALVYRVDTEGVVTTVAGVHSSMYMGDWSLWYGADFHTAPDEVANWVHPLGYGSGWGQRLTSPPFSFLDHPVAKLTFDMRVAMTSHMEYGVHDESGVSFMAVRGLQTDGTWAILPITFLHSYASAPGSGSRLTGEGVARCEVDLTGASLADATQLQILVETRRFESNEDGFGPDSQTGAMVLDNVRLSDGGGDVLAPLDFEDQTTGAWTLSAVNANFLRDFPPPATEVALRQGFDFSDPSCVWTFTSAGDSVPNGTYARITSPWMALAEPDAPTYITLSGKLPTDNQKRYLRVLVRSKDDGDTRPHQVMFSNNIYSSGTSGSDLASPYLHQFTLAFPDDFNPGTEWSMHQGDSLQFVIQIEDRLEEQAYDFPEPRVPSRLPYLDDIRIYQIAGDQDFDGVRDGEDACPTVSSEGQDADGDGCPDATATLRHVETWTQGQRPIYVNITQNGDPAITDGSDLQAVRDAIQSWKDVAFADVPLFEAATTTQTNAAAMDGVNLITWDDQLQFSPDILAITPTTSFTQRGAFDDQIVLPGQIIDSDLIFNTGATYRTGTTGPLPNSVDLQSVATHELGHLLGLSHSGVAQATMFPVLQEGDGAASLEDDDRAAIGAAYPDPFFTNLGTITGSVERGSNSTGIPGALVTAWSLDALDQPIQGVASDYTGESGAFALRGLGPGRYAVRVDPLDGTVPALIPAAINARVLAIAQTNFTAEWWSAGDDGIDDVSVLTPIDVVGGPLNGYTIITSIDVTPPEVVSVLPADGNADAGITGRVLVNVSEAFEPTSMVNAFSLRKVGDSGRLGGQAQLLNANRTFIFTPEGVLDFATSYEVEVSTELLDSQGVPLASTFVSHFSTPPLPLIAILDVQPKKAPPGALITIRGVGFTGDSEIEWPSASGQVITSGGTFTTPTTVVFRLDDNAVSGALRVICGSDTSSEFNITVLAPGAGVPAPVGTPVALPFSPSDVAVSPEGLSAFAVGDPGLATVNLSPTRPLYRVADFQALAGARRVAMARDGLRIFVTRPDSFDLVEVDTDTTSAGFGHAFVPIPLPGPPEGVFASPDGIRTFVTEEGGGRVWAVDVDPASPTYRSVLQEIELEAVLTGGIGLSAETETALGASRAATPPRPRTQSEPYDELYLTSDRGLLRFGLYDHGNMAVYDDRPCADNLETTFDGAIAIAIGSGSAEGLLTRGCLSNNCFGISDPIASLGGRPRDLVANPRTGGLFVVNSLSGEIQVLKRVGGAYQLSGQTPTGRSPVALAIDASGSVTVVANAGDRTLGIYGVGTSAEIASVQPPAAFPGDQVVVRLASGSPGGFTADIGSGPIAATFTRGAGLAFEVPAGPARTVNVSLEDPTTRTLALPLQIVEPITTLEPHATGQFMMPMPHDDDPDGPYETRVLTLSRDGGMMAALSDQGDAFPGIRLYQLRDDAPEPLYATLGDIDVPYFEWIRAATFNVDGKHLWTVTGAGGLVDYDVDPASPFFRQANVTGILPGETFAVAGDPMIDRVFATVKLPGSPYHAIDIYDFTHDHIGTLDFSITDSLVSVAVSPDGRVVVIGAEGRAFFVNMSGETLFPLSPSPQHASAGLVTSIGITGDGKRAVGVFRDGSYAVWSLEVGTEGQELHYGEVAPGVRLGPPIPGLDPKSVLTGGSDGNLYKLDLAGPTPAVTSAALADTSPVIARTPDGRTLFAAGKNHGGPTDTIRVYAMSEGRSFAVLTGDDQEALHGETLPVPVSVRLSDALGRPQPGASIEFSLADPTQGSLEGGLVLQRRTDRSGVAEVAWAMPAGLGPVTLSARALGLPITPVVVNARSTDDASIAVPAITAFGPPDGATGLSARGEVFVRFSQAMDSAQTVPYVKLLVGTDRIPGNYRIEDGGHAVFFAPGEPLPYLATCKLLVEVGAVDAEGQALEIADSVSFTVQAEPQLTIAVLSPPAGSPGTAVTLNGQGFSPVPTLNIVTFNGTLATVLSSSATTLIARVPSDAASGAVHVQVASATSNGVPFVVLPADPTPGTVVDTMPRPDPLRLVVTPDGRRAYVVSPSTNSVGALDIFTAQDLATIPVGANPRDIAMLPDGSRSYVANKDGGSVTVIATDPAQSASYNRVVGSIKVGPRPVAIATIYGGPRVVVVCEGDSSAKIIDGQRQNATFDQVIKNVPLPSSGGSVTVSPDGTRVFIGTGAGVSILDLQSFVIKNVPLPSSGGSVTVSPDGGLLFVITGDRHLVVIDVSTNSATPNRVIKNVPLPSSGGSVTVSPDGTLLFITLTDDGTVLVYVIGRGNAEGDGTSTSPNPAVSLDLIATHPVGDAPAGAAADPFGDFVLVANQASDDLTLLLTNEAPPNVEVLFPNGGETLLPGTEVTLTWDTDRFPVGQFVDLRLSRDLGITWETIATDVANLGTYEWLVTGPPTVVGSTPLHTALFEVRARGPYGTDDDRSDAPFAIYDAITPTVLLSFDARPGAGGIQLRWQFASPGEARDLVVERAMAAQGPWITVPAVLRTEGETTVAVDASATQGRTYWYRLSARFGDGAVSRFGPVTATMPVLDFALDPVAPNPARGPVTIGFAVARETSVEVRVIDVTGRRVATLANGVHAAGLHRIVWDGRAAGGRVAPGLYFLSYQAAGKAFTRRFVLAR